MKAAVLTLLLGSAALAQVPAPTNLIATSPPVSPPRVQLKWSHPGASYFKIYRSQNDSLHFQWINVVSPPSFEDQGAPGGKVYYYVTAVSFGDTTFRESGRSNIAGIVLPGPPTGPRGVARGKVTDDQTSRAIGNIQVRFYRLANFPSQLFSVSTDSLGQYRVQMDTGSYVIRAEPPPQATTVVGYRGEWYNNAPEAGLATPVRIAAGDSVVIDFGIGKSSSPNFCYINGRVTDSAGFALNGASVAILRSLQAMNALAAGGTPPGSGQESVTLPGIGFARGVVWSGFTNNLGQYHAQVVNGESYIAVAWKEGFLPSFFFRTSDPTRAQVLTIHGDTTGIDFLLRAKPPRPGGVKGTVRDSLGGEVPSRVILFPRPKGGSKEEEEGCLFTDEHGAFEMTDVPEGTYSILAIPFNDYAPAFYRKDVFGTIYWQEADTIAVGTSAVSGLTIGAVPITSTGAARITGTVTSSSDGPIPGTHLVARADGKTIGFGVSDQSGNYSIEALNAGTLRIAVDRPGFNPFQGSVIVPSAVSSIANVNFALSVWGPTGVDGLARIIPGKPRLMQNYPNPFNPTTVVVGQWSAASDVTLVVFDMLGREVATLARGRFPAGTYEFTFDGRGLASGVYLYRLAATGVDGRFVVQTRRMVLIR